MNSRHTLNTIVELESMKTQVFMSDRLPQLKNETAHADSHKPYF